MTAAQPRESLYRIEATLAELEQVRKEAEAEGDTQALAVIDQQIAAYLSKEHEKLDSYCELMRKQDDVDKLCTAEARRLLDRATSARRFREKLKELAMYAMNAIGTRVLESRLNKLRIQANGGVAPLEVNMAVLPTVYKTVTVRMPLGLWGEMLSAFADDPRFDRVKAGEPEADNALIRDMLKANADVQGVRELDRGEHLRLE